MKKTIAIISCALSLLSCSFLEKDPKVICADTYYSSEQEAIYALAAVYGVLNSNVMYGKNYSLDICGVDDLCWYNQSTSVGNETNLYTHHAGTGVVYNVWTKLYAGIKNANAFMEAIVRTDFDPDGHLYAEARFLRAYYHFLLAQAWGDVPLRTYATVNYSETQRGAYPQYSVLAWAASEMEECIGAVTSDVTAGPSRVCSTTVEGILARVYLFMAGSSVNGGVKKEFYRMAMAHARNVIKSGKHRLNPSYSQVFINMIADKYDTACRESMWEAEFKGGPDDPSNYSTGYIGNYIGIRGRSSQTNFSEWNCNYANGNYNGSIKLWDLYWSEDRTDDEFEFVGEPTDERQTWNLPPYHYGGITSSSVYEFGNPSQAGAIVANIHRNPYFTNSEKNTNADILYYAGNRFVGKWRREAVYEGHFDTIHQTTQINFPLLRYSDVLLMYAEAANEYYGAPTDSCYNYVKEVRDRAGIKTRPFSDYSSHSSFRRLVRNERARELCFEATRKFDLIRWGIFESAMKESYSQYYTDTRCNSFDASMYARRYVNLVGRKHDYLPIPTIELGVNPLLKQNPLW